MSTVNVSNVPFSKGKVVKKIGDVSERLTAA